MASFHHVPVENASPTRRRVLEHVERLLEGNDNDTVGTIAANLMIQVILADVQDRDLDKIDAFIIDLAAALREGCRRQIERDELMLQGSP